MLLISKENPEGWKLEDLLEVICEELEEEKAPSKKALYNTLCIISCLQDAIHLRKAIQEDP